MNNNLLYINRRENFLVYLIVFAAWWQFMLGLHLFEGGLTLVWRAIKGEILLYLTLFVTLLFYNNRKAKIFQYSKLNKKLILIFTFFYLPILLTSFSYGAFGAILPFLLIVFFLRLRDDLKVRTLDVFINVLALSLFFSLIEYFICALTSQYITVFSSILTDSGSKTFDQTLFNFISLDDVLYIGSFSFFRFQSLSDEPGNIGTICAFLLFATSDSKKYKYQYIIFWVSGIFSFSAAFYILAAIHLAVSLKKQNLWILFVCSILLFGLYLYFQEVFDFFIFRRFAEDGASSLDNRSTPEFDAHLKAAFGDGSLWLGKGFGAKIDTGGHGGVAGVKVYLWIYGIIGTVAILFGYVVFYLKSLKRQAKPLWKYGFVFLTVFLMSFYQREYITYFDYVLIFFTMPVFLTYKKIVDGQNEN